MLILFSSPVKKIPWNMESLNVGTISEERLTVLTVHGLFCSSSPV